MKRLRTGLLLAVLSLFVSASAVSACMNDRESARAEREFKSSYKEKQKTPAESQPNNQLLYYFLSGAGTALFFGAIALTVRAPGRRDTDV